MNKRINRKQIAIEISMQYPYLTETAINNVLKDFIDKIYEHLQLDDIIELRGFGTLKVVKALPFKCKLNKEIIPIPARCKPKIKFAVSRYNYHNFKLKDSK